VEVVVELQVLAAVDQAAAEELVVMRVSLQLLQRYVHPKLLRLQTLAAVAAQLEIILALLGLMQALVLFALAKAALAVGGLLLMGLVQAVLAVLQGRAILLLLAMRAALAWAAQYQH